MMMISRSLRLASQQTTASLLKSHHSHHSSTTTFTYSFQPPTTTTTTIKRTYSNTNNKRNNKQLDQVEEEEEEYEELEEFEEFEEQEQEEEIKLQRWSQHHNLEANEPMVNRPLLPKFYLEKKKVEYNKFVGHRTEKDLIGREGIAQLNDRSHKNLIAYRLKETQYDEFIKQLDKESISQVLDSIRSKQSVQLFFNQVYDGLQHLVFVFCYFVETTTFKESHHYIENMYYRVMDYCKQDAILMQLATSTILRYIRPFSNANSLAENIRDDYGYYLKENIIYYEEMLDFYTAKNLHVEKEEMVVEINKSRIKYSDRVLGYILQHYIHTKNFDRCISIIKKTALPFDKHFDSLVNKIYESTDSVEEILNRGDPLNLVPRLYRMISDAQHSQKKEQIFGKLVELYLVYDQPEHAIRAFERRRDECLAAPTLFIISRFVGYYRMNNLPLEEERWREIGKNYQITVDDAYLKQIMIQMQKEKTYDELSRIDKFLILPNPVVRQ
ncbi:hypothetical protein DFA_07237 [Cavenderia fasciculata]|uniref:Uncharacterized protein n=1 Tax=Cavenderia fasciculata TaxID=261658 RepID=F4PVV3_CACFS|nr:uncharacterized protein DFA_07237 [Cavenderia fasciculata]EGG20117.1 hypothetical protein DFA_07237 [Cavenderia fasciculata]|eukprot:XP_004367100.1 hypothetical protein DFA_07237 [Cavenderia fasciculata]